MALPKPKFSFLFVSLKGLISKIKIAKQTPLSFKAKRIISFWLTLIFVLAVNLYIRSFPLNFPQLKKQAYRKVEQQLLSEIASGLDKKYPHLTIAVRQKLILQVYNQLKRTKAREFLSKVNYEYQRLKEPFQDKDGHTYLLELDGWHWSRYVEDILNTGRPGAVVKDGKDIDILMCAPLGSPIGWHRFLFYLTAGLYRIYSFFVPVSLSRFIFLVPLFYSAIFFVVLFLFSYSIAGWCGGLFSCLYVGLSPIFIQRSCAGWFDTDCLNMLFPLIMAWLYLLGHNRKDIRQGLFWMAGAGLAVGLFSFTWNYWWVFFLLILIYEAYALLNILVSAWQYGKYSRDLLYRRFLLSCAFVFFSLVAVVIFSGIEPFAFLFAQVKDALKLNSGFVGEVWPNVYATVGELSRVGYLQLANYTGGLPIFIITFACLMAIFLSHSRCSGADSYKSEFASLFFIWALVMLFICGKGVRFAIFLLVPLGVSLGWMAKIILHYFKDSKKILCSLALFILVFFYVVWNNAVSEASSIYPLMNDHWYNVLVDLRDKTPKEAVINSWWDFGDWFKAVSRRRVIFDGQSQQLPQAHWMALILLSDSEEEVLNTLRMLNNGGNSAFEVINSQLKDPFASAIILKSAIRKGLQQVLDTYLNGGSLQKAKGLFFKRPDPAYFVVDNSMVTKMAAISFLGNWDFAKAYLIANKGDANHKKKLDYLLNLGLEKDLIRRLIMETAFVPADNPEAWITYPLRFYGTLAKGVSDKDGLVFFENGMVFNPQQKTCRIYVANEQLYKPPKSIFIFDGNSYEEINQSDEGLDFSVLIMRKDNEYSAIFLDRELGRSLFVRLYFLNGFGLKHFRPFLEEKNGNGFLRVFEIIW